MRMMTFGWLKKLVELQSNFLQKFGQLDMAA